MCPTSLYARTIRFPTFCRSLPSVGAYSQYSAWSGCRRSADVPRADHDPVGSSPWQGGFKERVYCAGLPSYVWLFRHVNMQPPLSTSSTKRLLMWPTFLDQKYFVIALILMIQSQQDTLPKNWKYALNLKIDTPKINWGIKYFIRSLSWKFELNQTRNRFFKIKQSFGKKTECTVFTSRIMYKLEVCSDGTTSAAPRSFRQNRSTASTLSDIMQVQHMSRNIRKNAGACPYLAKM